MTLGPGGLGTINIGNTGTSAAGTVNVGIGGTVNIGTNNTATTVTIGCTGGSTVLRGFNNFIGNTGIGGTTFQSGVNTFLSPITLGSAPASVNYNVAAPYIGSVITGILSGSFTSGSSAATINIVTTGTYLFTFSIVINQTISSGSATLTGTNAPCGIQNIFYPTGLGQPSFGITGSSVIPQATGNYNVNIGSNVGGTLLGSGSNYSFFYAVRIG